MFSLVNSNCDFMEGNNKYENKQASEAFKNCVVDIRSRIQCGYDSILPPLF